MNPRFLGSNTDAVNKLNKLARKINRLRKAMKAGERSEQVLIAAEKVRLAKLEHIKARFAFIRENPLRDPSRSEASKLCDAAMHWISTSAEKIATDFGRGPYQV